MNSGSICSYHHYNDGCFEMVEVAENYVDAVKKHLSKALADENLDSELLDLYALLVMVRGGHVTYEDVHDAWSIWQSNTDVGHPSLIPFDQLSEEVQKLDGKYAKAIKACAFEVNPRQINF
jgi:hypothetical protein